MYPLKRVIFHSYVSLPEGNWMIELDDGFLWMNCNDLKVTSLETKQMAWSLAMSGLVNNNNTARNIDI